MANIIALIWDFDKTLVDGYMQDPIFEEFKVDRHKFWEENNAEIKKLESDGLTINHDTYYLNKFIREAKTGGKFEGLSNEMLKDFGKKVRFYEGVVDFFRKASDFVDTDIYKEHDIKLENYIVSTGFKATIEGSAVFRFCKKIWGCEFIENEDGVISEIGYSLDNTSKTRALFEISKGVGIGNDKSIDANTKMDESVRRVKFINMIYSADGPSDIPAFSVINKNGGVTFGVYPKGDEKALEHMERLREDGRVSHYAEADFREKSGAYMWLQRKIIQMADRIVSEENESIRKRTGGTSPEHLV